MPAPRRDLEALRARFHAWLERKLPAARELQLGALSGPGTTGFSSDTLMVEARWREGDGERNASLVLRLEPLERWVFPVYDVGRQFRIQSRLAGTPVPVAPMRWLEEDADVLGSPFYVMDRVAGRIPPDNPPYHTTGWLADASPKAREALWNGALDVLADLHGVDWSGGGLGFLAEPEADSPMDAQLDYYADYLRWAGGPAQLWLEDALARLRETRPSATGPTVISWGDARIGNMIFEGTRCRAVVDWEMAGLGPPELDLGWFLYMDRHHSEGVESPRLPGLPDRAASVARYEARTGRPVAHLDWYEQFAAFRFAAIMVRLAQQMKHLGVLPADSRFEVDNTASRMLARVMDLPPPA